jgi:hypothetical protein
MSTEKCFIGWQPILGSIVVISIMQLKCIVMHGRVGRGCYQPAADSSTGYETNMVRYGIHSAIIEMYRRAADITLLALSIQIPATTKFGICGSLCRLCRLPADKRLSEARYYRRCVQQATNTRDQGHRSRRPSIGRQPIPLTLQQSQKKMKLKHIKYSESIPCLRHLRQLMNSAILAGRDEKSIGSCALRYRQVPLYRQLSWYRQTTSASHS